MEIWFLLAILSALLTGLQSFMMKVVAARGYSTNVVNGYALLVAALLGLGTTALFFDFSGNYVLGVAIAAATGVTYMFSTTSRIRALRYLNTAIVFPVYKALTVFLATLAGITLFSESLTALQMSGIGISLALPFFAVSYTELKDSKHVRAGVYYLLIAGVAGAVSATINKFGAPLFTSALMFGVFNHLFGMFTGFSQQVYVHRARRENWFMDKRHSPFDIAVTSAVLGVLIFSAFAMLMFAFVTGPLSIVYTINSLYFVIPIVLSFFVFKEHVRPRDILIVVLSLLTVFLLR